MASNIIRIIGFVIVILGGLFGIVSLNTAAAGIIISVGVLLASLGDAL